MPLTGTGTGGGFNGGSTATGEDSKSKTGGTVGDVGFGVGAVGDNAEAGISQDTLGLPGGLAPGEVPGVKTALDIEVMFDLSSLTDGFPKYPSYTNSEKQEAIVKTVSEERPEPIANFNLSRNSIIGGKDSLLYSSCLQALIEDRVSLEYASALFEKIKIDNPDFFKEITKEIQKEIAEAQNSINQLRNIFDILVVSDQALNPTLPSTRQTCANFASQMYDTLKIDSEPLLDASPIPSPDNFLYALAGNNYESRIESKTRSALICQLLSVVDQSLSSCMTNLSINMPVIKAIPAGANSLEIMHKPLMSDLKTLGANSSLNLVYGIAEYSYADTTFYNHLKMHPTKEERVLGLCTMLSNEIAISAGLGRLVNTPLGNKFGAETQDFTKMFLGVKNLPGADVETKMPNSLADYLLISTKTGAPTSNDGNTFFKPTLLLDGTFAGETSAAINSFDSFIKSVARTPDENKINIFSEAMTNCNAAFLDAIEFYKKVHLKDKQPGILTPRGLFSRILLDVSESMDQLAGTKSQIDANLACEIAVFKTLSTTSAAGSASKIGKIKHFLLGIIVRKAAAILSGKTYEVPKSPPPDETTTNVKVITKGANSKSEEFTIVTSTENNYEEYTADDKIPQFVASPTYESHLLDPSWMTWFNMTTFIAWAELAHAGTGLAADEYIDNVGVGKKIGILEGHTSWSLDVRDFVQEYAALENTLLDKIAKIFVEMCQDAEKFSQSESEDGSWLNELRLSRNSGVSGTLLISGLFEAVLGVVGMTADGGVTRNQKVYPFSNEQKSGGLHAIDSDMLKGHPIQFALRTGKASVNALRSKAFRLLSLASDSDTFETLEDQEMIPDLSYGTENVPGSTTVLTESGKDIDSFISYFQRLEEERELPLRCLFSAFSIVQQANHGTNNIQNIGKMLRGDLSPDPLSLSLKNFSSNDKTKDPEFRFLDDVSDYSLQIAQERLDRIKLSLTKPTGRLEKIRAGEVACIKIMLESFAAKGEIPNYLFYILGLPADFITTEILPAFSLAEGKESQGVNTAYLTTSVTKTETFSGNGFSDYKKHFFGGLKINSKSFDVFETSSPTSEDNILESIILKDGSTGKSFMQKTDLPGNIGAKAVLRAEVYSYLIKKMFSTIGTADLNENNLVKYDYDQRSTGAKNLARVFAKAANINENEFDDVFEEKDQKIVINWQTLLKKTAYPFDGDKIDFPSITHAQAELFYDIFGSVYFAEGKVHNKVFAPSVFDKTIGLVMTSGDFDIMSLDEKFLDIETGNITGTLDDVLFDEFEVNVTRTGEETSS